MAAPRNAAAYAVLFREAFRGAGLEPSDSIATCSDHEGAIRKGLRQLEQTVVGCGRHAVQHPPKHVIPPFRAKAGKKAVPASASDDDGSSSSSESGASSEHEPVAPVALQKDERQA